VGPIGDFDALTSRKFRAPAGSLNTVHPSRNQTLSSSVGWTLTVSCTRYSYVSLHSHWHEKFALFLFLVNVMYSKPNCCVFPSSWGLRSTRCFLERAFDVKVGRLHKWVSFVWCFWNLMCLQIRRRISVRIKWGLWPLFYKVCPSEWNNSNGKVICMLST